MNIPEAISKLKNTPVDVLVGEPLEFALAKRLGIEALEREVRVRDGTPTGGKFRLFPSETEEVE